MQLENNSDNSVLNTCTLTHSKMLHACNMYSTYNTDYQGLKKPFFCTDGRVARGEGRLVSRVVFVV